MQNDPCNAPHFGRAVGIAIFLARFKIKDHRLALTDKFGKADKISYFVERLKRNGSVVDRPRFHSRFGRGPECRSTILPGTILLSLLNKQELRVRQNSRLNPT